MAMDLDGFGRRIALSKSTKLKPSAVASALIGTNWPLEELASYFNAPADALEALAESGKLRWAPSVGWTQKAKLYAEVIRGRPFVEWLQLADRAEQVDQQELYAPIWADVNAHLKTSAKSIPELIEQLGVARFGKRPVVGDAFCGGGSIPFEAARLGCDVVASDLNPIACMLTWGALNIVGADPATRESIEEAQRQVTSAVDAEITALGVEHNRKGDRAKAFLYCLETRCPETGYMVPLIPRRVISRVRNVIAILEPDHERRRFKIKIKSDATPHEMAAAAIGTVDEGDLVVTLNDRTYRTPLKTIRGERKDAAGENASDLRLWERDDFAPSAEDIYQERLYAIQWVTKESAATTRQVTYFSEVDDDDLARERAVSDIVQASLSGWQNDGLISDMQIEPGAKTDEPIRTRGWTHWHHLFGPRHLLIHALWNRHSRRSRYAAHLSIQTPKALDRANRLTRWHTGNPGRPGVAPTGEKIEQLFDQQAINPLLTYAGRSFGELSRFLSRYEQDNYPLARTVRISNGPAKEISDKSDIWITDPPYADAVRYEEITEFFIAWLRRNPPEPFKDWVWDSRRALAIKGVGEDFKDEMISAYRNLANHMPDNGRQVVMFTHQDASVWADMAAIMWGAGLQVTAAWYIATETTSELRKGGYVQGTVLLVLRKRGPSRAGYRDEIALEIQNEVAQQIESLTGLNEVAQSHGRSENLFEDADLQMAGYAAALRVLTGYTQIDGEDMAAYAARPRVRGRGDSVMNIIEFAAETANAHLVPSGFPRSSWTNLEPEERFYLKMVDLEAAGLKKLDNYQNFAKAFRADWQPLMANASPNSARVKTSGEFGKSQFGDGFGETPTRRVVWAMHQLLQEDPNSKAILEELRTTPRYFERRSDIHAIAAYLGRKREGEEGAAASTLADLIENERLG